MTTDASSKAVPTISLTLTFTLDDAGWILLVFPYGPAVAQVVSLGVAALSDRSPKPVFPRWFGYFNLWYAAILSPSLLVLFFTHGAFAWQGLLVFWVPLSATGVWILATIVTVLRAIDQGETGDGRSLAQIQN